MGQENERTEVGEIVFPYGFGPSCGNCEIPFDRCIVLTKYNDGHSISSKSDAEMYCCPQWRDLEDEIPQ